MEQGTTARAARGALAIPRRNPARPEAPRAPGGEIDRPISRAVAFDGRPIYDTRLLNIPREGPILELGLFRASSRRREPGTLLVGTRRRPWPVHDGVGFVALFALAVAFTPVSVRAAEGEADTKVQAAREQFFEQNVRPLLAQSCYACHGDKKQKGGLRLDSLEAILKGGESGPAVVPGKPEESLLVDAINYDGPEMPPTGKLGADKVAILSRWVSLGAPWPRTDRAAHAPLAMASVPRSKLTAADRAFWSLRSTIRPAVPGLADPQQNSWSSWSRNAIDRFILKALVGSGLAPAPEADKPTLIRRLSFDLTGLPPAPEEVDAFLADAGPDAYERLVDRLLASPRYGQRWGRHWLDLVRYAESDGHRQDALRPEAWRYRDYVVRAFNSDKPYDRFLTEQLAGDELDPDDIELRVATGYLRMGTYEYNQRNVPGQWAEILNDITDVTGEVFLGLSIGCARCHDHKFDPILQKDYYRLQAFFAALMPRDDLTTARPGTGPSISRSARSGRERRPTSCAASMRLSSPIAKRVRNRRPRSFPMRFKRSCASRTRIELRSSDSSVRWPIARLPTSTIKCPGC